MLKASIKEQTVWAIIWVTPIIVNCDILNNNA